MAANQASAEAEEEDDEGRGWRLEAGEMGHESLGTVQLFLKFAEAEVQEQKQRPEEQSTCRVGPSIRASGGWMSWGKGLGWDMLAVCEVPFEAFVIQSSLETHKERLSGLM